MSQATSEPPAEASNQAGMALSSEPGSAHPLDYAVLLKPRVMSLVVFTAIVGLVLAPGSIGHGTAVMAVLWIAVGAGASGAINMWYDRDIDVFMSRTRNRPLPAGRMKPATALWVGVLLAVGSVAAMTVTVNGTAAMLLALTIAYYVFIYTVWLKRRTPQNIVIGGASGALPPVIGWAAVTGEMDLGAWILFAIIFFWTPPHFWSLALFRSGDYARAGVPMLPVVSGERETKKQILFYSFLMVPVSLLPMMAGLSAWLYGAAAAILDVLLIYHAVRVWRDGEGGAARRLFFFSIAYLFLLFAALLADHGIIHIGS